MILILSEENDAPTIRVQEYLRRTGSAYITLTANRILHNPTTVDLRNNVVSVANDDLSCVKVVWYRRWLSRSFALSNDTSENRYMLDEFQEFSSHLFLSFSKAQWLNTPPQLRPYPSKAIQLRRAIDLGLNVPLTMATNSRIAAENFYSDCKGRVITKNLADPLVMHRADGMYATYTSLVLEGDLKEQSDVYFTSLFQSRIDKEYEVRTFFFDEKFYSYAIFSSSNSQTSVDFRRYDYSFPNRKIRCDLPESLKSKLRKLMAAFKLDTGSIDLIFDGERYVFLEINPQGMFGGLERLGLYMERDIAKYLHDKDKQKH